MTHGQPVVATMTMDSIGFALLVIFFHDFYQHKSSRSHPKEENAKGDTPEHQGDKEERCFNDEEPSKVINNIDNRVSSIPCHISRLLNAIFDFYGL